MKQIINKPYNHQPQTITEEGGPTNRQRLPAAHV